MNQIARIQWMEKHLERAQQALVLLSEAIEAYAEAEKAFRELTTYYGSEAWKQDFADEEQGLLPKDLKRGVLSEDGIWNVLEARRELMDQMEEILRISTKD